MQTQFGVQPKSIGPAGSLYDAGGYRSNSKLSIAPVKMGARLSYEDERKKVDEIGTNRIALVLSADLVASNVFEIRIDSYNSENDGSTSQVATVTFASNHLTTMNAMVTELEGLTGIHSDTNVGGTNNRTLTIVAQEGYIISASEISISAGASQATVTKTNSDTRPRAGFAGHVYREMFESNGEYVNKYKTNDVVNNYYQGNVVVESPTGFSSEDALYAVGYGVDRGKIVDSTHEDGILLTDISFYKAAEEGGLGVVSINLP